MGSDSVEPTGRKHRRSTDEGFEEPSNRRPLHHHHHHQRSSRGKQWSSVDSERGDEVVVEETRYPAVEEAKQEVARAAAPSPPPPPPYAIPDSDEEEGEIVDDTDYKRRFSDYGGGDRVVKHNVDYPHGSRGASSRDKDRGRSSSRHETPVDRPCRERKRMRDSDSGKERDSSKERVRDRDRAREDGHKDRDSRQTRRDSKERVNHRGRDSARLEGNMDNMHRRETIRDSKGRVSYRERDSVREDEIIRHRDKDRDRDRRETRRDTARTNALAKDEEEHQDRIRLQIGDQEEEEEDLNRIKEESRRRRQAILDKYTNQQQQKTIDRGSSQDVRTGDVSETSLTVTNAVSALETASGNSGLGKVTTTRSDMFRGDDFFGESPSGVRRSEIPRSYLDDDPEGYHSYQCGEILGCRYDVTSPLGKGVFSTVVRAKDLKAGSGDPEVAIKIIRNNPVMRKAGEEELIILRQLLDADPENKRHCVRFISSFNYRNHLCLVFESLNMNLREVLKKFGREIGLKLTAVRVYANQLFIALKHLQNCGVLHCDIKPDNILVNEAKNVLKLCDFGSAMFVGKNEKTPYLVSRFYRAPEVILGLGYGHPMDVWSVGCCVFEVYTGKVLFPGGTNHDMLRLFMELKGYFPKKMLRKGDFTGQHFDQDLSFVAEEGDPTTRRLITSPKAKNLGDLVMGYPGEDMKMLADFKDLLGKTFVLDPEKRITVSQALSHPFITGR